MESIEVDEGGVIKRAIQPLQASMLQTQLAGMLNGESVMHKKELRNYARIC